MATGAHRWRQIEELYHAALEHEPGDRAALLERADPDVRREVESLPAQHTRDLPLYRDEVQRGRTHGSRSVRCNRFRRSRLSARVGVNQRIGATRSSFGGPRFSV